MKKYIIDDPSYHPSRKAEADNQKWFSKSILVKLRDGNPHNLPDDADKYISNIKEFEPERARNKKGHYLKDDPSTPDINEAYKHGVGPEDDRSEELTKEDLNLSSPEIQKNKAEKLEEVETDVKDEVASTPKNQSVNSDSKKTKSKKGDK